MFLRWYNILITNICQFKKKKILMLLNKDQYFCFVTYNTSSTSSNSILKQGHI